MEIFIFIKINNLDNIVHNINITRILIIIPNSKDSLKIPKKFNKTFFS